MACNWFLALFTACAVSPTQEPPKPPAIEAPTAVVVERKVEASKAAVVEAARAPAVVRKNLAILPPLPKYPAAANKYRELLVLSCRAVWGLTCPVALFAGQTHQESTWNEAALSRTGAAGLAQFMPKTSDWISGLYASELGANQPRNPAWAMRALARYDKHLYDRVQPFETVCDRMLFALSDYNGGSGWRMKRQKKSSRPGSFDETGPINPGITAGNQRENEEYPRRIVNRWQPLYLSWGPGVCT